VSLHATIGVLGLGLLGGSLVRGVRRAGLAERVVGVEARADVRDAVAAAGLCDVLLEAPGPALAACELVVLCAPIGAIEASFSALAPHLRPGTVVTDVAGTKAPVVAAATALGPEIAFVGGHPMFGGEAGGFAASRAELWRGGVVAVCTDGAGEAAVERVVALHRALGAEVVVCTADEHDAAMAAVSHLPFVVAGALALAARDAGPLALKLAGRGFEDATRLAGFRYEVQGEVSRQNAHLPAARARFEAALSSLVAGLAEGAPAAEKLFDEARAVRESRRRT
jgi:prephenate dehydrogenase